MNPIVKWIGGATAAVMLGLGGAVLVAGDVLGTAKRDTSPANAAAQATGPTMISEPLAQPVSEPAPPSKEEPFVIKRILPIDGPIKYGEWHWDDEGVPDGPLVITVDLDARVLSVFRNGYEIGAAAVLLGTPEHPTPVGTFPIMSKERHNVSEKYGNAPMPWTLRLTHDGVAIHGGSTVELGYASHGCIGSPDAFVSKLYGIAKKGDKVIITRSKTADIGDPLV